MTFKQFLDLEVVILEDWLMWADGKSEYERLKFLKAWFKEYKKGKTDVQIRTNSE